MAGEQKARRTMPKQRARTGSSRCLFDEFVVVVVVVAVYLSQPQKQRHSAGQKSVLAQPQSCGVGETFWVWKHDFNTIDVFVAPLAAYAPKVTRTRFN